MGQSVSRSQSRSSLHFPPPASLVRWTVTLRPSDPLDCCSDPRASRLEGGRLRGRERQERVQPMLFPSFNRITERVGDDGCCCYIRFHSLLTFSSSPSLASSSSPSVSLSLSRRLAGDKGKANERLHSLSRWLKTTQKRLQIQSSVGDREEEASGCPDCLTE